jgi:hypothetical protein
VFLPEPERPMMTMISPGSIVAAKPLILQQQLQQAPTVALVSVESESRGFCAL